MGTVSALIASVLMAVLYDPVLWGIVEGIAILMTCILAISLVEFTLLFEVGSG